MEAVKLEPWQPDLYGGAEQIASAGRVAGAGRPGSGRYAGLLMSRAEAEPWRPGPPGHLEEEEEDGPDDGRPQNPGGVRNNPPHAGLRP
ncbi:hypothetical protein AAFF_G00339050 [Aldrovandia affinis]|uniref:Uncharacterized protein n=1 Tax=Aldrovandia affinis TaxID=143900 RepID=A0AAD7R6I2_9TELE|nr:hypothetical protein AAFF_G00339050 [Aldrovandia affinis]